MGTFYGATPPKAPDGEQYTPSRQVSWGWIGESWEFFAQAAGIWVAGSLIYFGFNMALGLILGYIFRNPGYVPAQLSFPMDMKTLQALSEFGPNSPHTRVGLFA